MKQTIDISLDTTKIDKSALYESPKNGKKYLSVTVLIREEKDKYGYDGFVVQKISKERKAAGEKGPILGNCKIVDWEAQKPSVIKAILQPDKWDDDDMSDVPF
jgi:hypothetical protein